MLIAYHLPPLQYFGPVHESSSPDSWGSMHTLEKMLSDVVNGRFEFEAAEGTPSPIPGMNTLFPTRNSFHSCSNLL
jgi:hypothetical protein